MSTGNSVVCGGLANMYVPVVSKRDAGSFQKVNLKRSVAMSWYLKAKSAGDAEGFAIDVLKQPKL